MTHRWTHYFTVLALLVGLLACSNTSSGPSVSERATSLAQTAEVLLTSTAAASYTPATPTVPPSPTVVIPTVTTTPTPQPVKETPVPSQTPTPCANEKADFVADVNVPDGTHFAAGAAFQKTWTLRNAGGCAWTTAYSLRNVGGDVMSGQSINLPNGVPAGATVDLTVNFVAPAAPGKYVSHWQMFTPGGVAFGTKPYVAIAVP
jgi:hypothetical protein